MIDQSILKPDESAVLSLRSLYRRYGYAPYKMSKFESYEYYMRNKDFLVSDRIITFNDTNGRLMALKPDVTLSIIKNCVDEPGCKQKVCYNENIYRVSGSTHQYKEIMQAGLECIGEIGLYDIYETLSLAAQSLALIGEDFVLQISHLGVLSAVLDQVCADPNFQQQAAAYIAGKNAHDLGRLCQTHGVSEEGQQLVTSLISIYGSRSQVLSQLDEICKGCASEPLSQLHQLSALLDNSPHSGRIIFDFSVVGNMNYYNGIIFRGYLSGICDGILSGGQYDKLMAKMDRRSGAIGFALYLDLLEQLPAGPNAYDVDILLLYDPQDAAQAAAQVAQLTADGHTVSAQGAIPQKLRYRQLVDIRKEVQPC